MGIVVVYAVMGVLCAIFVSQFAVALNGLWRRTPGWLPFVLFLLIMLLLVLAPQQSEPLTSAFRSANP